MSREEVAQEKAKNLAQKVNNIFNVDNPESVRVSRLTREEAHALKLSLGDYSRNPNNSTEYFTKLDVELIGEDNTYYRLLIGRIHKENA